jgi:hypothetical protein
MYVICPRREPLRESVLKVTQLCCGCHPCHLVYLPKAAIPSCEGSNHCICLSRDDGLVLKLLAHRVGTYELRSQGIPLIVLVEPNGFAAAFLEDRTALVAARYLHGIKLQIDQRRVLCRVVREVLEPLVHLGYLAAEDVTSLLDPDADAVGELEEIEMKLRALQSQRESRGV